MIDALGTLITLEPPGPALAGLLGEQGLEVSPGDASRAFEAEIVYYRANHLRGSDARSLKVLRRECVHVLRTFLPAEIQRALSPAELERAMLAALHFRAYPDGAPALSALRAMGLRMVALSNWDVSLHDVLAELGLGQALDGILSSAEAGAAKPDARAFRAALKLAGVPPERAVHVGDSPLEDVQGALSAGIAPVLIHRDSARIGQARATDRPQDPRVPVIGSLSELPELLGGDAPAG